MLTESVNYRQAKEDDINSIYQIWLEGIETTFKETVRPSNLKEVFFNNFKSRDDFHYWVAEYKGIVIGFQSFLPLSKNPLKLNYMVESSTYIAKTHLNSGVGFKLLLHSINQLKLTSVESIVAFISSTNIVTIKIAHKLDFVKIGEVPKVGLNPSKFIYLKKLHD